MIQQQSQNDGGKTSKPYQCKCGKGYGSAAAVHTHINKKHPDRLEQYRLAIKKPQSASSGVEFRMKDIAFDEWEVKFMETSDNAFKNILAIMNVKGVKQKDFILQENFDDIQELSYDENEGDVGKLPSQDTSRDKQIHMLVHDLQQRFEIPQIRSIVQKAQQLFVLKIYKFKLNMVNQLIKYFNLQYAGLIQLQLQINASKKRISKGGELWKKLCSAEQEMWKDRIEICLQLQDYYTNWVKTMEGLKKSK